MRSAMMHHYGTDTVMRKPFAIHFSIR